jgi:hypothetical protein
MTPKHLSPEPANGVNVCVMCWVSVKDAIPNKDGTYLTFTKNKVSESVGFTLFVDGEFMSSFVTHWAEVVKPCT